MDEVKQYVISLLTAALLCSVVNVWIPSKGSGGALVRLISGILITITMISPLVNIRIQDFSDMFLEYSDSGRDYAQSGKEQAAMAMGEIIKQQTEAYILDKAACMGLDLEVEVTLSETDPIIPDTVMLKGQVSPYAKMQLISTIEDQLGIIREKQIWQ